MSNKIEPKNILNSPTSANKKFRIHIFFGNLLILTSFLLLLFTYYPILRLFIFPIPINAQALKKDNNFYIFIPKINAFAPILKNIDPFNPSEYQSALTQGIAHSKGTALPGENKFIFLFAHSSDLPWRLTRYNTIFFRLGELEKDDEISLFNNGQEYKYKVVDKKEVWPTDVDYLTSKDNENLLILQTCTPPGTSLRRLLIFAKPV